MQGALRALRIGLQGCNHSKGSIERISLLILHRCKLETGIGLITNDGKMDLSSFMGDLTGCK